MVLLLLSVEGVPGAAILLVVEREQLRRCDGRERNTLVCRPKEEIERRAERWVGVYRARVGICEGGEERGIVEEAGVEEVGRDTAGFEREGAKGQNFG